MWNRKASIPIYSIHRWGMMLLSGIITIILFIAAIVVGIFAVYVLVLLYKALKKYLES